MSSRKAVELGALRREALDDDFPSGPAPTEYLWRYLEYLGAESFVREEPYVDRHYLDDFSSFYARSWRVPAAHCARWHFFSCSVDVLPERFVMAASCSSTRMEVAASARATLVIRCRESTARRAGRARTRGTASSRERNRALVFR